MRDYEKELKNRIAFIKNILSESKAKGVVYGNSGGKDSALVGILCKMACENTVGIIMPCGSVRNYQEDMRDAKAVASSFGIETRVVDLTETRNTLTESITNATLLTETGLRNIAPRLRMTTLYAIAASENRLVAGTGNRSESYMGYFTKWGDGAWDFNPIADLTVTEVYEFLYFLGAPEYVINKAPSAALFDGQTDEAEMGITYQSIDRYLLSGKANETEKAIIEKYHNTSGHKRRLPLNYGVEYENK